MIPAMFDRGWVHPWRRPAEEKRSVRLSAPPASPQPVPEATLFRHCIPCDVKWRGGPLCWNCGRPA